MQELSNIEVWTLFIGVASRSPPIGSGEQEPTYREWRAGAHL
jgi:hypothetical protein